jgi:hypothetical protein
MPLISRVFSRVAVLKHESGGTEVTLYMFNYRINDVEVATPSAALPVKSRSHDRYI